MMWMKEMSSDDDNDGWLWPSSASPSLTRKKSSTMLSFNFNCGRIDGAVGKRGPTISSHRCGRLWTARWEHCSRRIGTPARHLHCFQHRHALETRDNSPPPQHAASSFSPSSSSTITSTTRNGGFVLFQRIHRFFCHRTYPSSSLWLWLL